jgi:RHS repeat-associated protein
MILTSKHNIPGIDEEPQTNAKNAYVCYRLVYNYYADVSNPTSCAVPSQGAQNNGNSMGYFYNNVDTTYNHIAAYGYDHVNRLTSAVATGNSTYNLTFSYTADGSNGQYGDMTCVVNGQTNGLCPQYTFNAANNQITGYSYDAAGNLTNDGTYSYQWDAEGRLSQSLQSGTVLHTYTYNARGQLAEDVATAFHTIEYAYDPSGQLLGHFMAYPPQPAWWHIIVPVLGRTAFVDTENWFVGAARIYHYDALGSPLAATDQAGAVVQTEVYYPWGQGWLGGGTGIFAGLVGLQCWGDNPCPAQSQTRDYPSSLGRWTSPDPLGGDITNPQSLNRYAYVLNNPTSLSDPTGLQEEDCNDFYFAMTNAECHTPPCNISGDCNGCPMYDPTCIPPPGGGGGGGGGTSRPNIPIPAGPAGNSDNPSGQPSGPLGPGCEILANGSIWCPPPATSPLPWILAAGAAAATNFLIQIQVTAQAPQSPSAPQQPSRLAEFGSCVGGTLKQTVPYTFAQLGHNLATSVKVGVPFGLVVGGGILADAPELLPASPAVLAITTGNTVGTFVNFSLTIFNISLATDLVAAPAYCAANALGF